METLLSQHILKGGGGGENNDSLVLDAASYFVVNQSKRVVLLSDDNNLRLRAKFEQVETLTIDSKIGNDSRKLLESLDPSLAPPPAPTSIPKTKPISNGRPPRRRSPEPSPVQSPPRPKPKPIPLPSSLARSNSMELEHTHTVPLAPSTQPPTLLPPETASAIFSNLLLLFSHFLALPLYRAIYNHFKCIPDGLNERQRIVLEELGDWREWDATRCAEVIKRWWEEGGVRALCEKGYERLHATKVDWTLASPPPPPQPIPPKKPTVVSPPPRRQSRWATTPTPPSSESKSAPISTPSTPVPTPPSRSPLSASIALPTLYSFLPSLIATFSLPPSSTATWSSIRFEIFLENVGNWLSVLLSGILDSSVKGEVERLVRNWEGDLKGVGVKVDRVKLGMY